MWKLWQGTSQGLFVHSVDFFCWCVLLWTLATQTWTPTSPHTWEEMGTMFHDDIKDHQHWLLHRHNKGLGYEDFIYVTAMKNFIAGVLTPVGGFMALKLGARPVMALGCLIMAWVITSSILYLRLCQCRLLPHLLLPGLGVRPGGPLHRLRARGES